ncbi:MULTISPECIES: class I SAM-dependent methyltransferase [unclassified Nostoc]|uniref:class I SAM-dependent methyltransferase n=1 Tax=unclassified Nostoc TaxID=2593658 RepID=UPI002AD3E7C2|nr:methyltransferase domain-containing protein [Nostoc sp. DedQUE03]MDZ7975813.1 methyltransferase domain-containing protein [Nostoc sp. DedQUE03]MDZ8048346.1 methyltransferase domain-containing protein [Nostoc sp. DedQUE02]
MIESNYPETNIDELIHKDIEHISKNQAHSQLLDSQSHLDTSNLKLSISYIESFLENAESRSIARTKWPDKLNLFPFNLSGNLQKIILKIMNFIFKDQREINFNIINSLKESVALNHQLVEHIATLKTQVDNNIQKLDERLVAMNNSIQGLDERLIAMDDRFPELDERLVTLDNSIQQLDRRLIAVENRFQGLDERLVTLDNSIQGIDDSLNAIHTLITNWLTGIQERLDTLNRLVQEIDEHKNIVDARIERMGAQLITTDNRINTANARIQEINEHYIRNDSYLKNDLMQQKRLITVFLEDARKRLPEPFSQKELETFVNEDMRFFDAFYAAFEEQFRGSREEILDRLKVYLPLIEEANIGTDESPILDVGCGRGEWLELLQESGYTARGLDINKVMVEQSRSRGFEVIEADVMLYTQSLPDSSLGMITGFHIIEHLTFTKLMKFFSEVVRVLKPGGLAIFETPNPQNVLVGSCNFYFDPTHHNPLPSSMIKFILETQGLHQVKVMNLHPYPESYKVSGSEVAERFNDYFYGAQDYAVVGYKL